MLCVTNSHWIKWCFVTGDKSNATNSPAMRIFCRLSTHFLPCRLAFFLYRHAFFLCRYPFCCLGTHFLLRSQQKIIANAHRRKKDDRVGE